MAQCWERRGCDEEMMSRCPHNIPGEPCPADCRFAAYTPDGRLVCAMNDMDADTNRDRKSVV